MRLLIVGGSRLLTWVVRRLVPAELEVQSATSPDQVGAAFRDHPPDAVLLNVRRPNGPWRGVALKCRRHRPPIPILLHAAVELDPADPDLDADGHSFFTDHLAAGDLDRLIRAAQGAKTPQS